MNWITEITIKIIHENHDGVEGMDKAILGTIESIDEINNIEITQLSPYLNIERNEDADTT